MSFSEKATTREPYPRLMSIEQDEMIWRLKHQLNSLEKRLDKLEAGL